MNRQIKFRAWNYAARSWQTEFTGMNLNGEILSLMPDKQYALNKDVAIVFQQFTGLFDKNGNEIYEGDIIKSGNGRIWEVKFGQYVSTIPNSARACGWYITGDTAVLDYGTGENDEVVGNIYQNPELIK